MLTRFVRGLVAGSLALGWLGPALAGEISGPARIVDGDTLVIFEQTVRLSGIDAPETAQLCLRENERKWPCGLRAADALTALVGDGVVSCRGNRRDQNGRLEVVCTTEAGQEINRLLLEAGLAVAMPRDLAPYAAAENRARKGRLGLWSGRFEAPWEYRARRWTEAGQAAPESECPIKGNIDRDGNRIYLMPHDRSYGWAKIDAGRGERWFCTTDEAVQAGWQVALHR